MTDEIKIFDSFLTPEELEKCAEAVLRPAWKFGHSSNVSPISTPFWMMSLTEDEFFNTQLLSKINAQAGKKFTLQRVYANGQTFGQDGTYHQDDYSHDSYTFCIYINKQITHENTDNIGGEFVFKLPNSDTRFSRTMIEPIYNRGILFPSYFFHKGLAFNRYNKGLRISIAWKLKCVE
jgi:hypothetical protein